MHPTLSIVMTNWNGQEKLPRIFPTVLDMVHQSHGTTELIVVDDASTDQSLAYLQSLEGFQLLVHSKNQGYIPTANEGVEAAKADYVLIMSNDLLIDQKGLCYLQAAFADPDVFAVSPRVCWWDQRYAYGRRIGVFEKGHFHVRECPDEDKENPTLFACGSSALFHREKFLALGGYDPLFAPYYYEEIDISYRAWKKGWRVLYEPRCTFYNSEHGVIRGKKDQKHIQYISGRNNYLFIWKNIQDRPLIIRHCVYAPLWLLRDLFHGRLRFWKCFFGALCKLPRILKWRWTHSRVDDLRNDRRVFQDSRMAEAL